MSAPERKPKNAPPPPFQPAEWQLADLECIQAIAEGRADSAQQIRGLKWIIENACEAYGLGWHPDGPHAASFVAGRRFAGMQIVKAINLNLAQLRKLPNA
jgi:hypothetical protein